MENISGAFYGVNFWSLGAWGYGTTLDPSISVSSQTKTERFVRTQQWPVSTKVGSHHAFDFELVPLFAGQATEQRLCMESFVVLEHDCWISLWVSRTIHVWSCRGPVPQDAPSGCLASVHGAFGLAELVKAIIQGPSVRARKETQADNKQVPCVGVV